MQQRILVIGAGVNGLTSALCLARSGFRVAIVADRFVPHVTSVVAGALWEWPPAVCGHSMDPVALARAQAWSATSYRIFSDLAHDASTGAFVRPVTFYFQRPIADDPLQRQKMLGLAGEVRGFRHDAALIAKRGVNPHLGYRDAYTHLAPMIDTDAYLAWLLAEVRRAGCRIIERRIAGPLRNEAATLLREFEADAIVNCAGLGARELGDESVYPLRGAIIRVRNDGRAMPRIEQAHCVSHDGVSADPGFIFIVPRGDDRLAIGGFAEPHQSNLNLSFENSEPIRAMWRRCVEFLPALRDAEIDSAEPVRVGLRPARRNHVRLEWEPGARIVHNYGHGGSGVTLSWGCAQEVVEHIERVTGR